MAIEALPLTGTNGSVLGLDINEAMLAVARSKSSEVAWTQGAAEGLPIERDSFERVVSRFGLMFFEDRAKAIDLRDAMRSPTGREDSRRGGHLSGLLRKCFVGGG